MENIPGPGPGGTEPWEDWDDEDDPSEGDPRGRPWAMAYAAIGLDLAVERTTCSPQQWPAPGKAWRGFPWGGPPPDGPDRVLQRVLGSWGHLVRDLDAERGSRDLSMRAWAESAGVATSRVEAVLSGRQWPEFRTLALLAASLDKRVVFATGPGQLVPNRRREMSLRGPNRAGAEAAAGGDREDLAVAWHNAAVAQVRWYARAAGVTGVQVSFILRVRAATWSDARHPAPARWVSLPMLVAFGVSTFCTAAADGDT